MTSLENALPGIKHVDVRGARLAYTESGEANQENLVLFHSNLSDIRAWSSCIPLLAADFHVVAYSRRYHWPNIAIPDGIADPWEEHAEDLAVLIERLNLAPAYVYGNSSAGTVVLILAQRRPDLVKALILEEPPLISLFLHATPPSLVDVFRLLWQHPWSFIPIMYFGATTVAPTTSAFKRGDDDAGLIAFCKGVLGLDYATRLGQEKQQQMRENLKPHRAFFCYGELPSLFDEDVKRIKVPVLVVTGQNTVAAHKHINRRLTVLLPDAEEVTIADATHFVHEDQPAAVVEALIRFVARARARLN